MAANIKELSELDSAAMSYSDAYTEWRVALDEEYKQECEIALMTAVINLYCYARLALQVLPLLRDEQGG